MVSAARETVKIAVMTALLIAVQLSLSFVQGVELVTAVLLSYSFAAGPKKGMAVSTAFSLLRCFIFGFFPSVIVLYLIYYNLFSFVCGIMGGLFKREYSAKSRNVMAVSAYVLTVAFTLIDDVVSPLILGLGPQQWQAYFVASVPVMIVQPVFAAVSVAVLFYHLLGLFKTARV